MFVGFFDVDVKFKQSKMSKVGFFYRKKEAIIKFIEKIDIVSFYL